MSIEIPHDYQPQEPISNNNKKIHHRARLQSTEEWES